LETVKSLIAIRTKSKRRSLAHLNLDFFAVIQKQHLTIAKTCGIIKAENKNNSNEVTAS